MADKKPLVMMPADWQKQENATDCHTCGKSLFKEKFLDSISVYDHNSGRYCGQSHRQCWYGAMRKMKFIGLQRERKEIDDLEQWNTNNQETCLFCAESSAGTKLQRLGERSLPHHGEVPRGST